jgi:short-subunit dehydrogenase
MPQARSVLITGASSGIGRGLARAYAAPGRLLTLIGRDAGRLATVAAAAEAAGADVMTGQVDVRDRREMDAWITQADAVRRFDLVIANAGITTGLAPDELTEEPEAVRAILATNLVGVLNTVEPLIRPMATRGQGHIALIGSIAGLRGLSMSPAYCVTKAGVQAYSEAIRGRLEPQGVQVSLVVAGFVKTPLNDSIDARKPFEISEDAAGLLIKRGLDRGKPVIAFPWVLYHLALLSRRLPPRFVDRLMSRFPARVPHTRERVVETTPVDRYKP